MKELVLIGVLVAVTTVTGQYPTGCGECEPGSCPKAVDCVAGTVLDHCGCCDICAKPEFALCDHPAVQPPNGMMTFGKCGENLECRLRDDLDNGVSEAICYCSVSETLCGSDNVTYDNICQLMAGGVRKKQKVTVRSKGPCKSGKIASWSTDKLGLLQSKMAESSAMYQHLDICYYSGGLSTAILGNFSTLYIT